MNDKSMLEVAIEVMNASNEPKNIYKLIDEVMDTLGIGDDTNARAQLYIDITTCADFVFLGGEDDLWDLKTRQPLEAWDKSFYENDSADDEIDDEDNISVEEFNYVEDEDEEESDEDSYDEDEDEEESTYEIDEDADEDDEEEDSWDEDEEDNNSWDEDEEEKYNDMMDDYEDLYEDK